MVAGPCRGSEAQQVGGAGTPAGNGLWWGRVAVQGRGVRNTGEELGSGLELAPYKDALHLARNGGPHSSLRLSLARRRDATPRPGPSRRRTRRAAQAGGDYFPRPARAPPLVLARRNAPRGAAAAGYTGCAAYKSLLVRRHLKPSLGGGRVSSCPAQPAARGGGDGARWAPSRQLRRPRASERTAAGEQRAALRCGAAAGRLAPRQRETSRAGWRREAAGARGRAGRGRGRAGRRAGGRAPGARMDGWPPWGWGPRFASRLGLQRGRGGRGLRLRGPRRRGCGRPRAQGTPDWRASPPSVAGNV